MTWWDALLPLRRNYQVTDVVLDAMDGLMKRLFPERASRKQARARAKARFEELRAQYSEAAKAESPKAKPDWKRVSTERALAPLSGNGIARDHEFARTQLMSQAQYESRLAQAAAREQAREDLVEGSRSSRCNLLLGSKPR